MLRQGIEFLLKGGWVMWPLFVCAITSVAVMIERTITLRRARRADHDALLRDVREALVQNRPADALARCEQAGDDPIARIIAAGVRSSQEPTTTTLAAVDRAMEEQALRELPHLNRRLGILDTIITLSPLLGLLGTITGMIRSFQVVATATGSSAAPAITGGVAEALIATATGLAVAICTLPVYNHLTEQVRDITGEIEARATQFANLLATVRPDLSEGRGVSAPVTTASAAVEKGSPARAPAATRA